jgi:hypothetical protein
MSEYKQYFAWGSNTLIFGDDDGYKWETTYRILNDIVSTVGMAGGLSPDIIDHIEKNHKKEDVKEFIRIVCEVNGKIYTETRHKQAAKKITVGDMQRTFDRYNIKIEVKDN